LKKVIRQGRYMIKIGTRKHLQDWHWWWRVLHTNMIILWSKKFNGNKLNKNVLDSTIP
jgi:hypothetical protein